MHCGQICRNNRWAIDPSSAPPILKLSTPRSFEPGDRADRVVGVQRADQQVAGERRLHGRGGRFVVADFADHDHVRVLPHDVFQRVGKAQAVLVVGRHLVDAGQAVFDRVFDRHDVAAHRVELRQQRVHRRRSCRSPWAR